jgi:cell division protein FtsI (penicillin-binding protein 3)
VAKNKRTAQAVLSLGLAFAFVTLSVRMLLYASNAPQQLPSLAAASAPPPQLARSRPDIVDRYGRLLATDIRVYWVYANPQQLVNADEAAEKIAGLFRDLDQGALVRKFRDKSSKFEWVKRGLTPKQAEAAHRLGIPGLYIVSSVQRVYPAGNAAAHILGVTSVDNEGISGIEKFIDEKLGDQVSSVSHAERPIVKLSLDLGVQHVLTEELAGAKQHYQAQAALGLVLDVRTGEVVALASLPDFDPNHREQVIEQNRQNRAVTDAYELGSVFKSFTIAMALDQGVAQRSDHFDVDPLRMGHFTIKDPHAKHGSMSVDDIFIHSSNTGAARIALTAGLSRQKQFLESLGLFERIETEAGISKKPVYPKVWGPSNVATISYGHGIAVPPLLFAAAIATLVNGGEQIKPTFVIPERGSDEKGKQLIKPETSAIMRELMRLTVERGTGRRAAVPGIAVGGKTGTAIKVKDRRYTHDVVNTFVAAFPIGNPKYLVMVTLDEPKPDAPGKPDEAAYNAAPTAGAIIKRIAPMLDILPSPRFDEARSTSYEQVSAPPRTHSFSRTTPHEIGGFGQGYSAFREPSRFPGPGYLRPYGR